MLYVSHSLDELQQVCDKLLVLAQGEVVGYGGIHEMIHQLNYLTTTSQTEEIIHQQTSLSLPIKHLDNGYGLTVLSLNDDEEIYLPVIAKQTTAQSLRCFILARDISISLMEPIHSSIVNHLLAKITTITTQKNMALVTALCTKHGEAQEFFVNISAFSQQKLALSVGQKIYLQFKAGAVRTYLY